jgi:deoxyribodipyrimidine photo-lyase
MWHTCIQQNKLNPMHRFDSSLVWFRRDLRAFDHAALSKALQHSRCVFCVFIFDTDILDPLLQKGLRADRRVAFIHASLLELAAELQLLGGDLIVRHAAAVHAIPALAAELRVDAVFANHDYEPQALLRDAQVAAALQHDGRSFRTFKDQVIFEKDEVLTLADQPFSVFTPYKNVWLKKLLPDPHSPSLDALAPYQTEPYASRLASHVNTANTIPSLAELGFADPAQVGIPGLPTGMRGGQMLLDDFAARIAHYGSARDFPALKGPSYLSVHLRFGTVSIRSAARLAVDAMLSGTGGSGAAVWLSELIWRDFYFMILHHHPHVVEHAFKPDYDWIQWESGPAAMDAFRAWCDGRTGYPLVDAAMAQLNQTGYMHNRLRMVTASFLIKDLGIDWRWGEHYFADRLNDYDLAANNGGWQWAASTGCDAQPYFRIFNPVTQSEKFDAEGKFIRRYLPQLSKLANRDIHAPWLLSAHALQQAGLELGTHYPLPIVQHDEARQRTLARYAVVKKSTA